MLKARYLISAACIFMLGSLCASSSFAEASNTDNSIVKEYFPQALTAISDTINAHGGPAPDQYFAYVDADLDGTGTKNYIVAVYSNGYLGEIRILKKQGSNAMVVASTSPWSPRMSGIVPTVRIQDVDGDGRPEVIASFSNMNGATTTDWIWKWDGTALHCISPALYGVDFVDLTGNGKLSAISNDETGQTTSSGFPLDTAIYNLVNGKFVRTGTSYMFSYFRRYKGPPHRVTQQFAVSNPSGQYELTIVNGGGTNKLVSSATVQLNGTTVASQKDFNQQAKVIKIPVTLKASNTVTVKLNGAPGSLILLSVGTQTAQ